MTRTLTRYTENKEVCIRLPKALTEKYEEILITNNGAT